MDCVSMFPKYERVKNYIEFVNQKKVQKLTDHILSGRLKSRYDSNELQRLATGKQLNLRE